MKKENLPENKWEKLMHLKFDDEFVNITQKAVDYSFGNSI
jgi:hypothetical protein